MERRKQCTQTGLRFEDAAFRLINATPGYQFIKTRYGSDNDLSGVDGYLVIGKERYPTQVKSPMRSGTICFEYRNVNGDLGWGANSLIKRLASWRNANDLYIIDLDCMRSAIGTPPTNPIKCNMGQANGWWYSRPHRADVCIEKTYDWLDEQLITYHVLRVQDEFMH